jgi:hypothetical protein
VPIITEYRHGMTMGIPPGRNDHMRAKRQEVEGWTDASTRRNTRFLYSVDERKLAGLPGFAMSLTIRDCPPSADDWKKVRELFFMRLRRLGMVRAHWLTEWQRRGVPHMHAAIWFELDEHGWPPLASVIATHWIEVASAYGAGLRGQNIKPITDSVGWFKYLSKHAVRGLGHYQRSADSIPPGWKKTGRMWGHLGEWPTIEPVRYTVGMDTFFAYRRMVQRWRLADARASGDLHRLRSARRMLQSSDRSAGTMRGVGEWISSDKTQQFLRHLAAMGHEITC